MKQNMIALSGSVLFVFLWLTTKAQTPHSHRIYSIPFRLTAYNNMAIKAVLNRQDTVMLMLHTASNDVTLTEEALSGLKTVHFGGKVEGVESWGGSENSSEYSIGNQVDIGGWRRDSVTIWKDLQSGQETVGKFGLNLFEGKVLEFDFDHKLLVVHPELPRKAKRYERLKLPPPAEDMMLRAVCRIGTDTAGNMFLLHSGYGGSILLDDDFAGKNQLDSRINITEEKKLQDAFGNVIAVKKGILPEFSIGKYAIKNAPVGFFAGSVGRQKFSVIGGDVLKRFNWIIDLAGGYAYIRPNGLFDLAYSRI